MTKYLTDQRSLQAILGNPMGTGTDAVKENILALFSEVTEVLNELNWKPWRHATDHDVSREDIVEEMVDVFMFYCNILNELEVSESEFDAVWDRKRHIVIKRNRNGY